MALYDNEGNVIERTVGTTVKIKNNGYSYWGDGEGTYYTEAVIFEDNDFVTVRGESRWGGYDCVRYDKLNAVDAPEALIEEYNRYLDDVAERLRRDKYNRDAYDVAVGRYAIVERGKRGRKHEGRHGIIKWIGNTRFGTSVLIVPEDTEEGFFVPAQYVSVIPEWEEEIQESLLTA